jgi:hypothetical protein
LAFPAYFPVTALIRVFRQQEIPGKAVMKIAARVPQVSDGEDVMGDEAGRFRARIRFFPAIFPVKRGI